MTTLAFLQNQWFKDPPRMERILREQFNGDRFEFCRTFLFFGCLTGRRLRKAFGDVCEQILWEEVSTVMSSNPSACPRHDLDHIRAVIHRVKPDVIITFGNVATDAVDDVTFTMPGIDIGKPIRTLSAPHPAARGADVPKRLALAAKCLSDWQAAWPSLALTPA